jgi:hypothetical protein
VCWQGHTSAEDSWEPVGHHDLVHCPQRVAEYDAVASRRPKASMRGGPSNGALTALRRRCSFSRTGHRRPHRRPATAGPSAVLAQWAAGVAPRASLLGRGAAILYWLPACGWQLGCVRSLSRKAPFTHSAVIGY